MFEPKGNFGFPEAIYFSSKKSVAKSYAGVYGEIMSVYLKIENPHIVADAGFVP